MLSEWKIPLFKRREIEPRELIQAVWQLPPMEPPALSSSPAEENDAPGELVVHLGHLHVLIWDDPRMGLAVPHQQMAPRSRLNDLLAVTIALSVLMITAILAVSLTLRVFTPKSALANGAGGGYADPLVLNRPPRMLLLAHTTPAPPAMPILRMVPVRVPARAPTPKGKAKHQARHVTLARADLYLPPLRHRTPDTSAPSEDWTAHGSFHSKANCEKFKRDVIGDTITAREADPNRKIYDVRIRLLMAGRCEDERQDQ